MILIKLLIFVGGAVVGALILKNVDWIVRMIGKSQWAEQRLGQGGTYTAWQLTAVGIMIIAFLIALFI